MFRSTMKSFLREEDGQSIVFAAVAFLTILSFLGFAVDFGHLHLEKRKMQEAADAAALAAALEVRFCGVTPNCQAMQNAARSSLTENGYTPTTVVTSCATSSGTFVLEINNPVCSDTSDPAKEKNNYAEVLLHRDIGTYFGSLVGFKNVRLNVRAQAARGLGGPCIYALNKTDSASFAIGVDVLSGIKCGAIVESSSNSAMGCLAAVGNFTAPTSYIKIRGGMTKSLLSLTLKQFNLLSLLGCPSDARVIENAKNPVPADPLAYLPVPTRASESCLSQPTLTLGQTVFNGSKSQVLITALGGNITFNPGVYCGGIAITASLLTNVTFNPGTYILKDGPSAGLLGTGLLGGGTSGGMQIVASGLLSSVKGSGVMFYNMSQSSGFLLAPADLNLRPILQLSTFSLTPQTSGNWGGVLFWQSTTPQDTFLLNLASTSILGGGTLNKFEGAIYAPNAQLAYGVNAISSDYNILVADKVALLAGVASTIGNNYTSLTSGSPLNGDHSELVR